MSGRPKPGHGDEADVLRELIREAHGAAKDLRAAVREAREVAAGAAQAAHDAGSEELARYSRHLQQEMNRNAADLNAAIKHAQVHVIKCLRLARLEPDPDGKGFRFIFEGALFDADVPVPDGPDMPETGTGQL